MQRSRATAGRATARPVKIGVSACLLGAPIRFDGGHKRDDFLTDALSKFVEFVPVCPEVEIGLGVPREALRLVRDRERTRIGLAAKQTGIDLTDLMNSFAEQRV